jgi:hypothetical protein
MEGNMSAGWLRRRLRSIIWKFTKPRLKRGRLTPKEMEELQQAMLRNLADPEVAKQVDEAEAQCDRAAQEAGKRLAKRIAKRKK